MAEEGSSLFLCPYCGAFISESSKTCPNCGKKLEDSADDELLELESEILEEEAKEIPVESPEKTPEEATEESETADSEPVTLFMCSVCGAFTSSDADNCAQCGASMDDGDVGPDLPPAESDSDILDMLVEKMLSAGIYPCSCVICPSFKLLVRFFRNVHYRHIHYCD